MQQQIKVVVKAGGGGNGIECPKGGQGVNKRGHKNQGNGTRKGDRHSQVEGLPEMMIELNVTPSRVGLRLRHLTW